MSYILDALRKADADRQRGHVPDLHSHAPKAAAPGAPAAARASLGWWVGAGATLALLAVAALWWLRPAPPASVVAAPAAAPAAVAPTPAVPLVVAPPPAAPAPPPLRRPPPPVVAAAAAPAAPAASGTSAAAAEVLPWARLPAAFKARLPPLAYGGSMYSPDPKARMLVIGGQAVHEGEAVAGGAVVVERIGEHAAQLRYDGQRFTWPYRP